MDGILAVSYTHLSRHSVNIPMQYDDYNSIRCEYVEMLENQIAKSNNVFVRTKLLTFGVNVDDLPTARARLERGDTGDVALQLGDRVYRVVLGSRCGQPEGQ